MSKDKEALAVSCLQHAVEDAQCTIRAFDSKSEILGVLLTLGIGITNYALMEDKGGCAKWLIFSAWATGLISMLLLGAVLLPKRDLFKKIAFGGYQPSETYYVRNIANSPNCTVSELAKKSLDTDWVSELMYENMKLSLIRDRKHNLFNAALIFALGSFVLISIAVLVGWLQ